jgi:xanthine dehydrogenase/oxidase
VAPTKPRVEPIFPPELRTRSPPELALLGPNAAWHRPLTLDALLALKKAHPDSKIVVGNTGGSCELAFVFRMTPTIEWNGMEIIQ